MPTIEQIEQAIDKGATLTWKYNDENGARIHHIALKGSMVRLFYNGHEQVQYPTFSELAKQTGFNPDHWILYPPIKPAPTLQDFGLKQPELLEVDPLIGRRVVITDTYLLDFLDEDWDAFHGTVFAPSPAWIGQYIVSMDNGNIRYLYREDFQVVE